MAAASGPVLDVVVLAGGGGERLGGVSKADIRLRGHRLLDLLLVRLAAVARTHGISVRQIVVVAPETVSVPEGVARVLENPPGGGPAAGVAAGFAALTGDGLVAVLTVDAPFSPLALPALLSACGEGGAVARNGEFADYLLGLYPAAGLARLDPGARDVSARRYLAPLCPEVTDVPALALADVDTWQDAEALVVAAAELFEDVRDEGPGHKK